MDLKQKSKELKAVYAQFRDLTRSYTQSAVCRIGCADCCTNVGEVYTTTLEAMLIFNHLKKKSPQIRNHLLRKLAANKAAKEQNLLARCAFLKDNHACAVYPVRPFSCRRLYSLRPCGETGPVVHRRVWEIAETTVRKLHLLDQSGYAGHLSYILHLLSDSRFRRSYLEGGLEPDAIEDFARSHGIIINRYADAGTAPATCPNE